MPDLAKRMDFNIAHHFLYIASDNGSNAILQMLIDNGACLKDPKNHGIDCITQAIIHHSIECLLILLPEMSISNISDRGGPMIDAAGLNLPEAIEELVKVGFSPDSTNKNGMAALHFALQLRAYDSAKAILMHLTDVNLGDIAGYPIHWAISAKRPEFVDDLLQRGARINGVFDSLGQPPCHVLLLSEDIYVSRSAQISDGLKILDLLLQYGYNFNVLRQVKKPSVPQQRDCLAARPTPLLGTFLGAVEKPYEWIAWLLDHNVECEYAEDEKRRSLMPELENCAKRSPIVANALSKYKERQSRPKKNK